MLLMKVFHTRYSQQASEVQVAIDEHLPARILECHLVDKGQLVALLRCGVGPGGGPWMA